MAGGIDWFRWHHGSVTDPKFQLVARKAGVRLGDVIAVWAFVLEKASADADRGSMGDLDVETLDFLLGVEDGAAARILGAMADRGLITEGRIAKWDERQPKREREGDSSTERVKAFRQRQQEQRNASETPRNANETQETPRGEERREEEIHTSLRSVGRASKRCPDSFVVTQEMLDWAAREAPGINLDRETAKFRDYTFSKARNDWPATWRNWIRKAFDDAPKAKAHSPPTETAYQRSMRERVEKFAPGIAAKPPGTQQPLTEVFDVAAKLLT